MKTQFSRLRKTIKGAIHSHKKEKPAQQNNVHDVEDDDALSYSSCSTISNNSQDYLPHCNSYSNLYYKAPNGNWLVQYRTREGVVIDTFEIKGHLI